MAGNKRSRKPTTRKKNTKKNMQTKAFTPFYDEIFAWLMIFISIFMFISNFDVCGTFGNLCSHFFFGIFGVIQYIVPLVIMICSLLLIANKFNHVAIKKTGLVAVLVCTSTIIAQMLYDMDQTDLSKIQTAGVKLKAGGGIMGGAILKILKQYLGIPGAVIVTLFIALICIILITEKSVMRELKHAAGNSQKKLSEKIAQETEARKAAKEQEQEEPKRKRASLKDLVVPLVIQDEDRKEQSSQSSIIDDDDFQVDAVKFSHKNNEKSISITGLQPEGMVETDQEVPEEKPVQTSRQRRKKKAEPDQEEIVIPNMNVSDQDDYELPSFDFLKKGVAGNKVSQKDLQDTATRLQQTLKNFGVNVTITNVSCGPTVTRFELQPEQGVKVSKIVNLTDDIKLNLAAADIRIEAPIPGKAAVGIEVPNRVNQMVFLRDLIENPEFSKFPSKIGFAVGRDLAGKPIYADIEKMPHMLIAGATGSGKSVCINTIIMSILYKANPNDVKLIMIDPKVVELSVYEGIPHLLIPVVTDPKKATGALNWAVMEMMDRYNKFAEVHVRNIKSYNQKVAMQAAEGNEGSDFQKMPQIVIIIDELADLMMVASRDVEDAIVRLTQLARAAGIHLIIATQRPSVNVITGLIKANVPSRIAFAVSSGVDSRTIIDMNGAERLLGNGDMLFFPSGYKQPIRVQGGFVSDEEIPKVVEFLKEQKGDDGYQQDIEKKVMEAASQSLSGDGGSGNGDPNGRDEYFYDAASFIIDKDKASIASLQRVFKIGFNRASRLMEQLCEAGVVGEEVGTKPRKVIMSQDEFERMKEEEM